MRVAELRAQIIAEDRASSEIKKFSDTLKKTSSSLNDFSNVSEALGRVFDKVLKVGMIGVGAALGIVTLEAKKSLEAFAESERVQIKVRRAFGDSADEILNYAQQLQTTTAVSDEEIALTMALAKSLGFNKEQVKNLIPTLLDLQAGLRKTSGETIDLTTLVRIFSRATLDDAVNALARYGVYLTKDEEKKFKAASATEKLTLLQEILNQKFGGEAQAQASSYAGKIALLQLRFNDLREKIGAALANALMPFIQKLSDWTKTEQADQLIQRITVAIQNLANWFTTRGIPMIKEWTDKFAKWREEMQKHPGVIDAITKAFFALAVVLTVGKIASSIAAIAEALKLLLSPCSLVIAALAASVYQAYQLSKQLGWLGWVIGLLSPPLATLIYRFDAFKAQLRAVWNWLCLVAEKIREVASRAYMLGHSIGSSIRGVLGGWQLGTPFVPETGLYLLHRGERVIPAGETGRGTITVNFYNPSVRSDTDLHYIAQVVERTLARSLKLQSLYKG